MKTDKPMIEGNIYRGPCTQVSCAGPAEVPDVLVNLTPHPLIIAGLPGEYSAAAATVLGRAAELGMLTEGYALVVPSHGSLRLVERPVQDDVPRARNGQADRFTDIAGRVPDCIAPFGIPEVTFGEVAGDLPPALPPETITDGWDARGMMLPEGESYTFAVPGHYHAETAAGPRVWFVVSLLTAMALRGRHDILTIGPEIRSATGQILGCMGLRRVR